MNIYSKAIITLSLVSASLANASEESEAGLVGGQNSFKGQVSFVGGTVPESRVSFYYSPTGKLPIGFGVYYGYQEVSIVSDSDLAAADKFGSINRAGLSMSIEVPIAEHAFISSTTNLGGVELNSGKEGMKSSASSEIVTKIGLLGGSNRVGISFGTIVRFDFLALKEGSAGSAFGHSAVLPVTSLSVSF